MNNETREDRLEEFLWYNKDEEVIGPKDSEALYWFRQAPKGMKLERIPLGTKFDVRKIVPGGKI